MNYSQYLNKVRGCWLGKNIGGTLGAPLESHRGVFDVEYYLHDTTKGVLPNDDLDLQLAWLNAVENYGNKVNSEILGNYWLLSVTPYWSEYGQGKANMKYGIHPPASGRYKNQFSESCGCFIRSEIWACLAPGRPQIAVKYAYEDACVDHSDEGIYAELFCAAIQSAAFAESDRDTLIDIGLSYIPEDCALAGAVKLVRDCYYSGDDWKTARKKLMCAYPDTFGLAVGPVEEGIPEARLGYDAPCNVGIVILGWMYGENDFSKSICIAAACGEDADCTAGTLAAILGIILEPEGIEDKWKDPIGDEIKTCSLDVTGSIYIPPNVTNLTRRVAKAMIGFMGQYVNIDDNGVIIINTAQKDDLYNQNIRLSNIEYANAFPYMYGKKLIAKENGLFFDVFMSCDSDITIKEGEQKDIELLFMNNFNYPHWVEINWNLPDEWEGTRIQSVNVLQYNSGSKHTWAKSSFIPRGLKQSKYEFTAEIKITGFISKMHVPLTFVVE